MSLINDPTETAKHVLDNLLAGSAVRPAAFKSLYPIHVFDVSIQSG